MSAFASPHADVVRMGDEVKARLAAIAPRLPGDMKIAPYWDQTTLIVDSQASLRDAILIGALLAIAVILFFLRDLRMTAAAAIVVPSAMAIAVLALAGFGQTLNIMSVGGLAIAVGLIIDDAIVVIEGIARTMAGHPELPMTEAIVSTMRRLIAPMTASTLTTVVVFVPLAMLGGVTGSFFRALALTLSSALIVSLALAIFATPIFVRRLLAGRQARPENPAIQRALERYEPILRWALGHRAAVYAGAGLVLVVTATMLLALPSDFLPQLDEGQFEIKYTMPVGTTLAASDAAARKMERAALADPAVVTTGRQTGVDTNGFSPTPPRVGTVRIGLKPLSQREEYDAVSDRIRDAVSAAVPSAQLDVHQILEDMINDISGAPAPIEIEVSGPDPEVLADGAQRVADRISKVAGVADAFSGVVLDDPTLRIAPDFARLARSGADAGQLSAALEAGSTGTVDTSLPEPSMLVPVRVMVAGMPSGLPDSVALRNGNLALGDLAATHVDRSSQDVTQMNGRRVTIVTANVNGRSLSAVVGDVRSAIARAGLPPGYDAVIGGAYRLQQDSFREFVQVILVALLLVFFVMLVSFSSYRQPLVILTAVPLALIGVALGLFVTRTPFNVSSFMGLLLLVGIVVKNGILLIDAANRRRTEGFVRADALVLAGRERLRPILMTTFAAIGGLLPLAFGIGAGAAMERPLAIAVVGGLSTATAFTLVLIPVLYDAFVAKETA
jgi:multidrug efflux pump subunit AcrB